LKKAIFEEIIPSMDFDETELKALRKMLLEVLQIHLFVHELKSML